MQVYTDSDGYHSLTSAMPINVATKVRSQLQTQRKLPSGGPGVEVQDVGPGLAGPLAYRDRQVRWSIPSNPAHRQLRSGSSEAT